MKTKESLSTKTPANRRYMKFKLCLSTLVVLMITLFVLSAGYGVYSFFTTYGIQSPVTFRSPIYRIKQDILISPVSTGSAKKTSAIFDLGKIADRIYQLESSSGKNDGCNKLGLYNGYGYRQNSFEWICYNSHEEARQHVINWLETNIKDGNIEKALCLYNKGIDETGCTYAMNFNSL